LLLSVVISTVLSTVEELDTDKTAVVRGADCLTPLNAAAPTPACWFAEANSAVTVYVPAAGKSASNI
jgi:hypothetical protein